MAKNYKPKSECMKIEVKVSNSESARVVAITVTASANDFAVTDLLQARGVIVSIEADLQKSIRASIEAYVTRAENLIQGLTPDNRAPNKHKSEKQTKRIEKGEVIRVNTGSRVTGDASAGANPIKLS